MKKRIDILEGSIGKNLFKLSLPVILTSLISILYNLTDIKFISTYLGDKEVSSAAAATFFIIFAMSFLMIAKNGAQILVAQSIGAKIYK
ncbi:MATE family efflux transporter, partial [Oceanivirga salmonicida]